MSETMKTKPNNTTNYIVFGKEKELVVSESKSQDAVHMIPGIPMEIPVGECTITNETPDGRIQVIDKETGNVIGYLDSDGTLNRKLAVKDREKKGQER